MDLDLLSWRTRLPRDLRFKINRTAVDTPWLGEAYLLARAPLRQLRAQPDSVVVFDGYPRSANTFGYVALRSVVPEPDKVRGHTHSARNVLRSVRLGVPTAVVVRDPADAVASLLQMAPGLTPRSAFEGYTRFHEALLPLRNRIHIARFEDVVADMGQVIEAINRKFACAIPPFGNTPEQLENVRAVVDENTRRRSGGVMREHEVSRPSASRRKTHEVLAGLTIDEQQALDRASAVYRAISSASS